MNIKEIKNWFEAAVPNPTVENACVQVGCHYEEVVEMMEVLGDSYGGNNNLISDSEKYKAGDTAYIEVLEGLSSVDDIELLDALCDQIVTAVGVAHMLGYDIEGALAEVNASNFSKFENGQPVFNESGKIKKGTFYRAPELLPFIGGK